MIGKEVKSSSYLALGEVKELLEERKKEGELGYEQLEAYEYVKKFAKLNAKESRELIEKIMNYSISEKAAAIIANILPDNPLQVKQILSIEKNEVNDEIVSKIIEIVKEYSGKHGDK